MFGLEYDIVREAPPESSAACADAIPSVDEQSHFRVHFGVSRQ